MKDLQKKQISLAKVLWRNHKTEEATWESEEVMRQQYPQLFNEGNFEDEILLKMGELCRPKNTITVFITCLGYKIY